jgi:hypothetical protein
MNLEQLQYPIGHFEVPSEISEEKILEAITILEVFPLQLRELTSTLTDAVLDTKYRPEGWTIRQVVHHISDSHHHSYSRIKWALTEDNPVVKVYDEKAWAELVDSKTAPVAWSLTHIEVVHQKMVHLLRLMTEEQWNKTFRHPESGEETGMKLNTLRYAWHSMHHFMHIKNAIDRM